MSFSKNRWFEFIQFKNSSLVFSGILISFVLSIITGLFVPGFIAKLGETYSNGSSFNQSLQNLGLLLIVIYLNRVLYQLIINYFVRELVASVRSKLYEKWITSYEIKTSGMQKDDKFPMGEVIARIISDTESFRDLVTSGSFGIVIDILFVISGLIGFIKLNFTSGIFLGVIELLAAFGLIFGSKYMRDIFQKVRAARGKVSRAVANVVGGLGEAHYMDNQKYASKKGSFYFDDFLKKQLMANVWDASFYSLAESLFPVFLVLIVLIFPYSKITETAVIIAIIDLIQRSIGPIKDIASKIANIQRAITGFNRISEFQDHLDEGAHSPLEHKELNINFKELKINIKHFSYSGNSAEFSLDDIEFSGSKGELIGLVGLSGSGKSTVLNILSGNIIPKEGEIKISSDKEVLSFPGETIEDIINYRYLVGIVSQDSHIFTKPMYFNLTLSDNDNPDFYKFWDFVCEQIPYVKIWNEYLQKELNTNELSLGQKQLICALRACFLKRPIVLFDEISSALDSNLEEALRKVILLVQKQSLTIIVAHRFETIIQANKIVILEKGRKVGEGVHDNLIKTHPTYQQFISHLTH
ncbi:MAG: ABC transporter ATP-binding protein [Halobacteriovoraceae bacterium]|nr:ABC transporter ATP-binding protein [Halobacteriovoraceae bacterium]